MRTTTAIRVQLSTRDELIRAAAILSGMAEKPVTQDQTIASMVKVFFLHSGDVVILDELREMLRGESS